MLDVRCETLKLNSNVAIAGGGLLGRLLAWQLLEHGHRVSLYEAGSLTNSSSAAKTAAGMVSPISEAIDTEPLMYDLGIVALQQWPQWLQQLSQAMPDQIVHYSDQGSLIVAHQRDQSLLQQYGQDMQRQLPTQTKSHWVQQPKIQELEPDIAEYFSRGLYFPEEAHIDNRHLLDVLLQRIKQLGGQCIDQTPVNVGAYTIREEKANTESHFDSVIDCRGVGAKPQWKSIRGVRGEVLRVETDEITLNRPVRLLHPRYQLYVVPKLNNEFVIGATQIESEDQSPMSVQSALELNSALYAINPAFAEARIIEMDVNLRPALNDNRPKIQSEPGLLRVNGLYRHGYLVAPAVVQHTLSLLINTMELEHDFSDVLFDQTPNQQQEELQSAHAIG